jgi:hypothetical protein
VEKDVGTWAEEAEQDDKKLAPSRLSKLEFIINKALGENSKWHFSRNSYWKIGEALI